jgi:hypothetical protein
VKEMPAIEDNREGTVMSPDNYCRSEFTVRHRIVSFISRRLQWVTYRSRQGLTKGLKRKGGLGFLPFGSVETAEIRFLQRFDFTGKVVYDLGSFQGLMTIFFAKTAKRVFSYEANPLNVSRIQENALLNGFDNVIIRNVAIGSADGLTTL